MEQGKTDALFEEMNAFLSEETVSSEAGAHDPDEDALPYESLDDFSTDPVGFGEMAARMLAKVENLFDLSAVYNRHSEKYLKICAFLEKGIKFLGSACISKSAMEREEIVFPELGQLSTMKLYRMASFNYRKLDAALTEKLEQNNDLYPELLDMEFRYFNLLRRLRSTETKIHNYHSRLNFGSNNQDPVREGTAFSAKSWAKYAAKKKEESPAFRNAPAFPLLAKAKIRNKVSGSVFQASKKSDARKVKSRNKSTLYPVFGTPQKEEAGSGESEKNPDPGVHCSDQDTDLNTQRSSFNSEKTLNSYKDENGRVHIDVSELRQRLMKEAHDSGDPDLMMEITGEPSEKLYERWRQKYGGDPLTGPAASSRSGPPEMTRKKLRGKRKKRK